MPATMLCIRRPADEVDFANERFVVCKWTGVNAYGVKYEMGDELPPGTLNPRALAEIYDTPTRLIETMDYALADEELLAAMMARPVAETEEATPEEDEDPEEKEAYEVPDEEDEERDTDATAKSTPPVALKDKVADVPRPRSNKKRNR